MAEKKIYNEDSHAPYEAEFLSGHGEYGVAYGLGQEVEFLEALPEASAGDLA